ncbi:MAG: hypothetical protein M3159_09130, partial [Actinomycetota bacterium]|nr:hypothetical protein [Actinomycetota bacterium]
QQASACQPYGALVSTAEGLVPIGRLVETRAIGTKVLDANGMTTIVAVKANGRKDVLRLHTRAGYSLDVTADHLVWRAEGEGGGRFVPAGQLGVGDALEWHATDSWGNGEISRQWVAEAALAGWLQADGFVRRGTGRNETEAVELATVTAPEYHWVLDAVDAVSIPGLRWSEREDKSGVSKDARRIALTAPGLPEFLDRWGLDLPTLDAEVPQQVFAAPTPVVTSYLRSLFQAEGFVSTRAGRRPIVGLAMGSEGCVRGIQSLLLRFGIFSKIRFVAERRPDRRGAWVLNITGADVRRFVDDIGFVDATKASELRSDDGEAALPVPPTRAVEVERIERLGGMDVYDIQTESGEYLSGNIRVHNCFILAVEDTMQSILNWYVEEGTIFKGGSGAGINLSTIRSSQESLKGGGTASGPVSFMRGADASAGTIKCLHGDTPISTDGGVVAIRDAKPGAQVLTRHGFREIEAVHDNGVRPLVKVTTSLGDEILCTPEHRFRVRSNLGGERWREAKDIRPDDHLVVDLSSSYAGNVQELRVPPVGGNREVARDLPTQLDEPFGLWLGWIFGDGSITTTASQPYVAVQIGDDDQELRHRYAALTRGLFGESTHIRFCSSRVIRFLELNGLRKGKAAEVRVPVAIHSSPAAVRAAFLSGLFEADGCVDNGYPSLATVSAGLALDVHRLLLSIGIPSKVKRVDNRNGAYGTKAIHNVRIVGGEGVRRFAKLVGFISERKSRQLEAAMERKDRSPDETQWFLPHVVYVTATVAPAGEGPTFDLTVDGVHEYLVNNVPTHNSGGTTRRAAKMVILNADHPDVEDFIWCKAVEERKARVLRDAGFDMDLDGKDSHSTQYQNANNSVRVTDEFMQAVVDDGDWHLRAVKTGEPLRT